MSPEMGLGQWKSPQIGNLIMVADIKWCQRIRENRYFEVSFDDTTVVKIVFVVSLHFELESLSQQDNYILDNKLQWQWERNKGFDKCEKKIIKTS